MMVAECMESAVSPVGQEEGHAHAEAQPNRYQEQKP
jgi:hypothetical protein